MDIGSACCGQGNASRRLGGPASPSEGQGRTRVAAFTSSGIGRSISAGRRQKAKTTSGVWAALGCSGYFPFSRKQTGYP